MGYVTSRSVLWAADDNPDNSSIDIMEKIIRFITYKISKKKFLHGRKAPLTFIFGGKNLLYFLFGAIR